MNEFKFCHFTSPGPRTDKELFCTLATKDLGDGIFSYGLAIKSPEDNASREMGRVIASQRAELARRERVGEVPARQLRRGKMFTRGLATKEAIVRFVRVMREDPLDADFHVLALARGETGNVETILA